MHVFKVCTLMNKCMTSPKKNTSSCLSSEVEPFGVGLKALEIPSTVCQGVGGGGGREAGLVAPPPQS